MKSSKKRIQIFAFAAVLSLLLMYFSYLPVLGALGRVLVLFSTLFHELGHGITAIILGGKFKTLEIYWDGSGITGFLGDGGRITTALTAAGGLVGPSIAAALLFWAARGSDTRLNISTRLFAGALVLVGLMTARSPWAVIFTLGLGILLLALAGRINRFKLETLVVFIGVQLGLSVFTRADYLFTRTANSGPSDVAQMAQALFLPFWFWGVVCGLFSVAVLLWGCRCYVEE